MAMSPFGTFRTSALLTEGRLSGEEVASGVGLMCIRRLRTVANVGPASPRSSSRTPNRNGPATLRTCRGRRPPAHGMEPLEAEGTQDYQSAEPMKTAPVRGKSWGRIFIGCYGGIRIRSCIAWLPCDNGSKQTCPNSPPRAPKQNGPGVVHSRGRQPMERFSSGRGLLDRKLGIYAARPILVPNLCTLASFSALGPL